MDFEKYYDLINHLFWSMMDDLDFQSNQAKKGKHKCN